MKKLISVLLLIAMLLTLTACGGDKKTEKQEGAGIDALVSDYGFQWTDTSAPIVNEKGAQELSFTIYSSKNASASSNEFATGSGNNCS